jgi:hypothetical protein
MSDLRRERLWLWAIMLLAALLAAATLLISVPRMYARAHGAYVTRVS